jgi:hypothetical protein
LLRLILGGFLGLLSFISECGFGGIRKSAPIRRLVVSRSVGVFVMSTQIPLDNAPRHAQAIGRLVGHWAIVENHLVLLFGYLASLDHIKAQLIYQNFVSQSAKIDMIRRLANQSLLRRVALNV